MKKRNGRLCIYPKDVQIITGKSERYARYMIVKIKKAMQKEKHQFLTIEEFCFYTGLDAERVMELIKG